MKMEPILTQLMETNRLMQFNLMLPESQPLGIKQKRKNKTLNKMAIPYSLIAQQLTIDKNIISAFKSLYNKYIDSIHAPFMINIASKQRQVLTYSLDDNYYKQEMKHLRVGSASSVAKTPKIKLMATSISTNDENKTRQDLDGNSNIKNKSFIDDEWKANGDSIEWLLKRLIIEMDRAALEVSQLINDSFQRFRANAPTIVKELEST